MGRGSDLKIRPALSSCVSPVVLIHANKPSLQIFLRTFDVQIVLLCVMGLQTTKYRSKEQIQHIKAATLIVLGRYVNLKPRLCRD